MYKEFTAKDYKKLINFPTDYKVDGLIAYGTFKKFPFTLAEESLQRLDIPYECNTLEHELFDSVREIKVNDQIIWIVVAYGGALLCEIMHLACLFGSKKNILLGSCGGLKSGASSLDVIVPTWSFAEESSAKAYSPSSNNKYESDKQLSDALTKILEKESTVYRGPTITYQAMMAETWNDIQNWSQAGYLGVEMEAATVFSISKHFKIPAAAVLMIADYLIEKQTVLDNDYEKSNHLRRSLSAIAFDTVFKNFLEVA